MKFFCRWAWAGIGLGMLSLNALHPAQADPAAVTNTVSDQPDPQTREEQADRHAGFVPILIGGCVLFTLAERDGFEATTFTGTSAGAATGATVAPPAQGTSLGASLPSSGQNVGSSVVSNSLTTVPETPSWAAFACMGVGAANSILRTRRRRTRP